MALFDKVRTSVKLSLSKEVRSQVNVDEVLDCRIVGEEYTGSDGITWSSYSKVQTLLKNILAEKELVRTSPLRHLAFVLDEFLVGDRWRSKVPNFMGQGQETELAAFRKMESGNFHTNHPHDEMAETINFRIQKLHEVILPVTEKANIKTTFIILVPELTYKSTSILANLLNGRDQKWLVEHIGYVTLRSDIQIVNFLARVCDVLALPCSWKLADGFQMDGVYPVVQVFNYRKLSVSAVLEMCRGKSKISYSA